MFDIDSTPPATIASAWPGRDPLLRVDDRLQPGAAEPIDRVGRVSAAARRHRSAATRATFTASGGCAMLPTITSSSSAASNPVRARSSPMTTRPRSAAPTSFSSVAGAGVGGAQPIDDDDLTRHAIFPAASYMPSISS